MASAAVANLATVRTPEGGTIHLKQSFAADNKISVLFTGGTLRAANDARVLFCPCDTVVNVVDAETGKVVRYLEGDVDPVMTLAVSPDDECLVFSSRSRMLRVYDWRTGTCTRAFKAHDGPVMSMDFDKSSTLLATGSADSTIKVWDVRKGFCTHNFTGSVGVVSTVMFHPKRLELYSCCDDGSIRIWSLTENKLIACLNGHNSLVRGLAFSFSDTGAEYLVSGGRDSVCLIWDLTQKQPNVLATIPVFETVEAVALLPEDCHIASNKNSEFQFVTSGNKGELRVWSYPSLECVSTTVCKDSELTSCTYNTLTEAFHVTTAEHTIMAFDAHTFDRTKQFIGSYDQVVDVKFIGEQESHFAVATNTEYIQVVDVDTMNCTMMHGHTDIVLCLDVSSDGKTLISGSKDNSVHLWCCDDEGFWKLVAKGTGHAGDVTAVAIAPKTAEGAFAVTASKDFTLKAWSLQKLGDRTTLCAADDVTNMETEYTRKAHDKEVNHLAVSPNDKLVVSSGQDRLAKVWVLETGAVAGVLKGHRRGIWSAKFSPVDQVIVTASGDATLKLWAIADFSCLKTFEGHATTVLNVQFLCRGMQLLSADADGLLKLWNIKKMELTNTLDGHEGRVWGLAVSRDETRAVTGAQDGTIILWRDDTLEADAQQRQLGEERLLKIQDLDNLISQKDMVKAAKLALQIQHPLKLLKIFEVLLRDGATSAAKIGALVKDLATSELGQLMQYIQDWNTNSRTSLVAQAVLNSVLKAIPSATLLKLPNMATLVAPLLAFSDRHFNRLAKLQQQSRLVDYTWAEIKNGVGSLESNFVERQSKRRALEGPADSPTPTPVTPTPTPTPTTTTTTTVTAAEEAMDTEEPSEVPEETTTTSSPPAAKKKKKSKKSKKIKAVETETETAVHTAKGIGRKRTA